MNTFALLYASVADVQSQNQIVTVAAFYVLGYRHVRLPLWNPYLYEQASRARELCFLDNDQEGDPYYDFSKIGFSFKGYLGLAGFPAVTGGSPHYIYRNGSASIMPEPGDVVLDCGGGGFESFLFASLVGSGGHVHVVDMNTYPKFDRHIALNQELAKNVTKYTYALWDKSEETVHFNDDGGRTKIVSPEKGTIAVSTITIDDLVSSNKLKKIDFIKTDLEGADLNALLGAEKTISTHRPKLAISVYHSTEDAYPDYIRVVAYLKSLDLGYKFYFTHNSLGKSESVLFAKCS